MTIRIRPALVATLFGAAIGVRIALRNRAGATPPQGAAAFFDRMGIPWLALDQVLKPYWPFVLLCIAGWALFSLYWEAAATNSAPARSSESPASRSVHLVLVSLAQLLVLLPFRGLGRYLPVSPFLMAAGLAVQASGTALAVWARRHLGRNWSGAISIKVEHRLIRSGPYRFLRHPIYTGLLAMYLGPALVTGERLALLGVALVLFAYWRKIRLEEAALHQAFGADYDAYCRATWALVPGLF
jgi:protein-S-isoprenylcysteine O-methyltransferase Ste14